MADLAAVERLKQASQDASVALYVDDIIAALRDVEPMYEAEGEDGMGTIAWERCIEAIRDIAPSSEKDKFDELV